MRTAIKDLKTHAYLDVTVVYGRKPGGKPKPKTEPAPEPAKSTGYQGDVVTIPEDYQGLP
jgi:hypothetical protein